jgi:hypothetical protein
MAAYLRTKVCVREIPPAIALSTTESSRGWLTRIWYHSLAMRGLESRRSRCGGAIYSLCKRGLFDADLRLQIYQNGKI